jgi:hypothetical protein
MEMTHMPQRSRVLLYYDLPQLASAITCPVELHGLSDGAGDPAGDEELARYHAVNVRVNPASDVAIVDCIHTLLNGATRRH